MYSGTICMHVCMPCCMHVCLQFLCMHVGVREKEGHSYWPHNMLFFFLYMHHRLVFPAVFTILMSACPTIVGMTSHLASLQPLAATHVHFQVSSFTSLFFERPILYTSTSIDCPDILRWHSRETLLQLTWSVCKHCPIFCILWDWWWV